MNIKKTIAAIAAVATAVAVFGQEESLLNRVRADYQRVKVGETNALSYMTGELWIQYANELAEFSSGLSDNSSKGGLLWGPQILHYLVNVAAKDMDDAAAESMFADIDTKFANAGLFHVSDIYIRYFPKAAKATLNANYASTHPVATACAITNANLVPIPKSYDINQKINILVEKKVIGEITADNEASTVEAHIKAYTVPVKRYLREHGKTFVIGEDGKNPVQEILDELSAGFASPNCQGVKQFLAKYAPNYTWVEPNYKTAEEIEALKNAVYFGEKDLTESRAMILRTALGVDAYNEFIDSYNSDNNQ